MEHTEVTKPTVITINTSKNTKQAVQDHPFSIGFKQAIGASSDRLFRKGPQHMSARVFHREQMQGGEFVLSKPWRCDAHEALVYKH